MIFNFFLYNIIKIIKIKNKKYNYHNKIENNLTCIYAKQMYLYSLKEEIKFYSTNSKLHEFNYWLSNKYVQYIYF